MFPPLSQPGLPSPLRLEDMQSTLRLWQPVSGGGLAFWCLVLVRMWETRRVLPAGHWVIHPHRDRRTERSFGTEEDNGVCWWLFSFSHSVSDTVLLVLANGESAPGLAQNRVSTRA